MKNILLRFIKLILIFRSITKKKKKKRIQVVKNGFEHIFFITDVYFNEYILAVESNERKHVDRDLIFEEKRQKALEKKLDCKFIRTNTSKKILPAYKERKMHNQK